MMIFVFFSVIVLKMFTIISKLYFVSDFVKRFYTHMMSCHEVHIVPVAGVKGHDVVHWIISREFG